MHATHYIPRLFCQRIWNKSGLALFAGSIVLATVTETEESNTEIQPEKVAAEEDLQAQQNASLPTAQQSALETELKKAQESAQLAEKMADLAEKKLGDLEAAVAEKDDQLQAELKQAQERVQLAEKNSDLSDCDGPVDGFAIDSAGRPAAHAVPVGNLRNVLSARREWLYS